MANRLEEKIRKSLAKNLSFLSTDLTLVEEEYKLDNAFGSKGYIDILALDKDDNYVIIEIKRSNQAARQALNEICKYPMLLKHSLRVKPSEIRIMIVSTEWHELLVPFSEFSETCMYNLEGYKIQIDENANPVTKELILPIEKPLERMLSRGHTSFLFYKPEHARENSKLVGEVLQKYQLMDYVILLMSSNKNIMYPNSVYVTFQRYSKDYYLSVLKDIYISEYGNEDYEEMYQEIIDYEDDCVEEEYLLYLEECILEYIVNEIDSDSLEIGYPEKLTSSLNNGWKIDEVLRGGTYKEDQRLKDSKIIVEEIIGVTGGNYFHYLTECSSKSKAKLNEIKKELEKFLEYQPVWKSHILSALDQHKPNEFRLSLYIFNPGNMFEALYSAIHYSNNACLPHYVMFIDLENEGITYIYNGYLSWNGKISDFRSLFYKIYPNDVFDYHFNRFSGNNNQTVIHELGLGYVTDVIRKEGHSESVHSLIFNGHQFDLSPKVQGLDASDMITNSLKFMEDLVSHYESFFYTIEA